MGLSIVQPRTTRLNLSDGAWVEVKEVLNHGEYHDIFERVHLAAGSDDLRRQSMRLETAMITAYLVDWSLTALPIRDLAPAEMEQRLRQIHQEEFQELSAIVSAHIHAVEEARAEKKRIRSGDDGSARTSPSPVAAAGAMNG